jgi:hypothetical protein
MWTPFRAALLKCYRSPECSVGTATGHGLDGRGSVFTLMLLPGKLASVVQSKKEKESEEEGKSEEE